MGPWTLCAKLPKKRLTILCKCGRERDREENTVSWRSPAVLLCISFFMLRMLLSFDLFLLRCNDEFDRTFCRAGNSPLTERKFYLLIQCCGGGVQNLSPCTCVQDAPRSPCTALFDHGRASILNSGRKRCL